MEHNDPPSELEAEGIPPPGDQPQDYGVTAAEEVAGESLSQRMEREEPETRPGQGAEMPQAGRLVEPESEVDEWDETAEPVAADLGADTGAFTAEEAAMHVVDEDADLGLTYDEGPGYLS